MAKRQQNKAKPKHQCKFDAETVRTRGTIDPKPVLTSLVMSYRAQIQVVLNTATPSHDVTLAEIMAKVPGGSTTWPKVRITHYEAWAGDAVGPTTGTPPLNLRLLTTTSEEFGGDNASFSDAGTFGSRRPHISVRPGLFQRLQWADAASVNGVVSLSQVIPAGESSSVILQVSLEMRSLSAA